MSDRDTTGRLFTILIDFKNRRKSKASVIDAMTAIRNLYEPAVTSFNYANDDVQIRTLEYEHEGLPHREFAMCWAGPTKAVRMTTLDLDDARIVLPALQEWVAKQDAP